MESRQDININSFNAPKLNLDVDNTLLSGENVFLKNALNLHIEGNNSSGYYATNTLSNELCFEYPKDYVLNGKIELNNQEFVLFFKTKTSSEIGILKNDCTYKVWVNDPCLNFNTDYWITGFYKFNKICDERTIYINDAYNPDRIINIDKDYPKLITSYKNDNCKTPIYSDKLDCDELLSTQKIKFPCIILSNSTGILPDGKYQIAMAYSDNVTNYSSYYISDAIILFGNKGIEIELLNIDKSHENYKLVLIGYSESGNFFKELGIYSTAQNKIIISNINNKKDISSEELFTENTSYIKSKHTAVINNQLIKAGLIEREDIYYQPQANKIKSNWVVKRILPENSYKYPQYMRDEVYSFFIQWISVDGFKYNKVFIPNNISGQDNNISGKDLYEQQSNCDDKINIPYYWAYNSASKTFDTNIRCDDIKCENIIQRGNFSYFKSEEYFSDEEFEYKGRKIKYWGNLACTPILLHKFPDNSLTNHYFKCDNCDGKEYVDILGIEFNNIEHPKDLDGNYIKDIIGYRILRGDRNGNETILSKGLFNNFLYDSIDNQYFQNFPYNSLEPNAYISKKQTRTNLIGDEIDFEPATEYSKKLFSYISPETSYTLPQVGNEISLYGEQIADLCWKFQETYKHPKHILLTIFSDFFSNIIGITEGIFKFKGSNCITKEETIEDSCLPLNGITIGGFPIVVPPNPSFSNPTIQNIHVSSMELTPAAAIGKQIIEVTLSCDVIGVNIVITSLNGITLPTPLIITGTTTNKTITHIQFNSFSEELPYGNIKSFDATVIGVCEICNGLQIKNISTTEIKTSCTTLSDVFDSKNKLPGLNTIYKILTSAFYGWEAIRKTQITLKGLSSLQQYAYQFDSVANYNRFETGNIKINNKRREIKAMDYLIDNSIQFDNIRINNNNRVSSTFVLLNEDIEDPLNIDNSRFNFNGELDNCKKSGCCDKKAVSYYGGIKRKNFSPYGQLEINTIPISCWNYNEGINKLYKTEPLFNGDTYITKFSVKNHFQLFLNIPIGEEAEFIIDYTQYGNIGFPRYWINSTPLNSFSLNNVLGIFTPDGFNTANYHLDCPNKFDITDLNPFSNEFIDDLFIKKGKFYTSVNGVFNFYVESSYINNYRKKTDSLHYPLETWEKINRSDKQILDNRFEYNQFLRLTEISEQSILQKKYNPLNCNISDYKLIYSEPESIENHRDNWKIFRPLSYTQLSKKDGELTTIHAIDDNNLLISFEDKTYVTQSSETLITKNGNSVFLGSGDIFSRGLSSFTEDYTGYTGSLDKYSFYNTRYGTTWVDRKRKKIFLYDSKKSFKEISNEGINQWLQFHLSDKKPKNHKESIKVVYDNKFDVLYFTNYSEDNENYKIIPNNEIINIFKNRDASWTLSYKPNHGWVSFHSFIPFEYFTLPNHFLSSNDKGIWKHNKPYSYHIFYGNNYPYFLSYIINNNNDISQSIQLKHETLTELNFNSNIYHNDIFFDKFLIFSERANSGLKDILLKIPQQISSQNIDYEKGISCDYNATNYWSLNNYRNFSIEQPHYQLNKDGHTFNLINIGKSINPNKLGNIEGNWFQVYFINTLINNKRFKTYFSINTKDKIKTNR